MNLEDRKKLNWVFLPSLICCMGIAYYICVLILLCVLTTIHVPPYYYTACTECDGLLVRAGVLEFSISASLSRQFFPIF
jgi:hypothetical protein